MATPEDDPNTFPDTAAVAAEAAALLDKLEALIPGYTALDPVRSRSVTINARYAQELITPTIAAINNYEPLRQHNLFDADKARRALKVRDDLRPLQQRLAAITDAVAYTIDSRLADSGVEAMQAYRWSMIHVRFHKADSLKPYVETMKSVVKKAIGRKSKPKKPPETPAPEPAPAPETTEKPKA